MVVCIHNMLRCCKSVGQAVVCRSYHSHLPHTMKCLALQDYANTVSELKHEATSRCPTHRDLKPEEALIKVHAASVNPIDIAMSQGYGRNMINTLRQQKNIAEFPLILGRDFSGTVVERGKKLRRFQLGESVYGVRDVVGQGTHAEYVIVNKHEISPKPKNIDHVSAASLPYVACTTWFSLIATGAVPTSGQRKKILIPGGSGGIGSFAAQLCEAYGHHVVTTCASDAIPLLTQKLSLQHVIDYKSSTYEDELRAAGPFDVILDTLGGPHETFLKGLLRASMSSHYVTLRPSVLPDTDSQGVALGLVSSGSKLIRSNVDQLASGKGIYSWGLFRPNALVLNNINDLVENGAVKPLVDKVYSIDDIYEAYLHSEGGHARGKTVITMTKT